MTTVKVFITDLARYNGGELHGEWVSLPMDGNELEEKIDDILGDNEEYFITDYETDFELSIGEYTNVYKLNEELEELEYLGEHEQSKVKALLEWGVYKDFFEAVENMEKYTLNENIKSESDVGYDWIDNIGTDIDDFLIGYIDVKRLGKDLSIDGYFSNYGFIYGGY